MLDVTSNVKTIRLGFKSRHDVYFQDVLKGIKNVHEETIDLVVTSPPYWRIKDYGNADQVGYHDSLESYLDKLAFIFKKCISCLKSQRKLCVNVGDQFLTIEKTYQVIPIASLLVSRILQENNDVVYIGCINWSKVTRSNTSGGGQIMGSYPYPRNGYFFTNREYILIFKKVGKDASVIDENKKIASKLSKEEWRKCFRDTWTFKPEKNQDIHPAMFPLELPSRLIKMYTFVGDVVLDPFLGSGTTVLSAVLSGRNSVGFEIGFKSGIGEGWKDIIKKKVNIGKHIFTVEGIDKISGQKIHYKIKILNRFNFMEAASYTKPLKPIY